MGGYARPVLDSAAGARDCSRSFRSTLVRPARSSERSLLCRLVSACAFSNSTCSVRSLRTSCNVATAAASPAARPNARSMLDARRPRCGASLAVGVIKVNERAYIPGRSEPVDVGDGAAERLLRLLVMLVPHLAHAFQHPLVAAYVDVAVAAGVVRPGHDNAAPVVAVPVGEQPLLEGARHVLGHLEAEHPVGRAQLQLRREVGRVHQTSRHLRHARRAVDGPHSRHQARAFQRGGVAALARAQLEHAAPRELLGEGCDQAAVHEVSIVGRLQPPRPRRRRHGAVPAIDVDGARARLLLPAAHAQLPTEGDLAEGLEGRGGWRGVAFCVRDHR
eukprot:scaffold102178_cov69-Phaeocystis_antarctica.AAC.3